VVHSTFIYEVQHLNATAAALTDPTVKHDLRTFRLDADYHFGTKYTLLAGPFITTGTADAFLFPAAAVTGSTNGKPNNKGAVAQFAYWPMQNIEFGLQYRRTQPSTEAERTTTALDAMHRATTRPMPSSGFRSSCRRGEGGRRDR
jgi:hypothetical protein